MAKAHTNKGWAHRPKPPSGIPARGEGWGGDKAGTGSRKPLSADNQPSAEAKMAGKIEAATARDIAKAHAVEMAELLATIARDPAAPPGTRVDAAHKLIERAEGKAAQAIDMTTAGKPMGYVIPAPAEAPDADTWTQQHKPR